MKRFLMALVVLSLFYSSTAFAQWLDNGWNIQTTSSYSSQEVRGKDSCLVYDVWVWASKQAWFDSSTRPTVSDTPYLTLLVKATPCGGTSPTMNLYFYGNPKKKGFYTQESFAEGATVKFTGNLEEKSTGVDVKVKLTLTSSKNPLYSAYNWVDHGSNWNYSSDYIPATLSVVTLSLPGTLESILRETPGSGSIEDAQYRQTR